MAFFQDLGKKISSVTQDAAKKTSELIEVSKLNSQIGTEKAAISELHKKIGETVYSLYTAGEPIPDALAPDVQGVAERLKNIADLENKIAAVKAADQSAAESDQHREESPAPETTPPAPPQELPSADAPMLEDNSRETTVARFCTACGSPITDGMAFCGKCGAKAG